MNISEIYHELRIKQLDLSYDKVKLDTPEYWVLHTTRNWLDMLVTQIEKDHSELRPKMVLNRCCEEVKEIQNLREEVKQ